MSSVSKNHDNLSSRAVLWLALGILGIHAGMLAHASRKHSPTMLEPALLVAGLSHWEFGRFELYRVNPPLVRMVAAIPVIWADYEADWTAFRVGPGIRSEYMMGLDFIVKNGQRSIYLFTIARWACIPFSIIGAVFAFFYSREIWRSNAAGLLTLTIWCFEPNILAHAELITNDVACLSFSLGATWLFWRWLKVPTWSRAILAGALLGFAQLAKSSCLILFLIWPFVAGVWWFASRSMACDSARTDDEHSDSTISGSRGAPTQHDSSFRVTSGWSQRGSVRLISQLFLIQIFALYILNLGYGFDGTFKPLREYEFISSSLTGSQELGSVGNRFRSSWLGDISVPLPEQYVLGLDMQKHDFEDWGNRNFLMGEWKHGGWWYYYLYGMCVKVPHGVHLLFFMSLLWSLRNWIESRRRGPSSVVCLSSNMRWDSLLNQLMLVVPSLVLFIVVSSQVQMNEHFRYVLPTVGMLAVFSGRAVYWWHPSQ